MVYFSGLRYSLTCLFTLQLSLVLLLARMDGQAELTWVADCIQRWCERDSNPRTVTHSNTNRAQRRA